MMPCLICLDTGRTFHGDRCPCLPLRIHPAIKAAVVIVPLYLWLCI